MTLEKAALVINMAGCGKFRLNLMGLRFFMIVSKKSKTRNLKSKMFPLPLPSQK